MGVYTDDRRLAARWAAAVLAGDADTAAIYEAAAGLEPLTAAAKKKKDDKGFKSQGVSTTGMSLREIAAKSAANAKAGRRWDVGFTKGSKGKRSGDNKGGKTSKGDGKGFNPFRKGKGAGGGQFTTSDKAGETDVDEDSAAKKELAAKRKQTLADRKAEDEAKRRRQVDESEAEKATSEQERQDAATRKAAEAAETGDYDAKVRANQAQQVAKQGEITLAQRQLAEARQLGNDADEIRLTEQIRAANEALETARRERAEMEANREQTLTVEKATAAYMADRIAAARAARQTAARQAQETDRRTTFESRAKEDAEYQAASEALQARIDAARAAKKTKTKTASAWVPSQDRDSVEPPSACRPEDGGDGAYDPDPPGRVPGVPAPGARPSPSIEGTSP